MSLLETFLLVAAMKAVSARRIFEIGTFLGSTTLNLALNAPDDAEVFTLDMDGSHAAKALQLTKDAQLTAIRLAADENVDYLGLPVASKIHSLIGDSTRFDFTPWMDSIDMVFIDGGHDLGTVKSDTENAFRIASKSRPTCIAWHDYGNRDYSAVAYFLDSLARNVDIVHVEDTQLCVWFNDPSLRATLH